MRILRILKIARVHFFCIFRKNAQKMGRKTTVSQQNAHAKYLNSEKCTCAQPSAFTIYVFVIFFLLNKL